MDLKGGEAMKAAKGEFYIRVSEKTGKIKGVFDINGPWKARGLSWEPGTIEKVNGDIALLGHSNPAHWCVIGGRRQWCPLKKDTSA
jgi:hypothetical protein